MSEPNGIRLSVLGNFGSSVLRLAGALFLVGLGGVVALLLWDTRTRIVDTHEKTNMVFCRVFPERCAPVVPPPVAAPGTPGNATPSATSPPDPPKK